MDFFNTDKKTLLTLGIYGTSLAKCSYCTDVYNDLRFLLSLGDEVEDAVNRVYKFFVSELKLVCDDYSFAYYQPLTYVAMAKCLADYGYYHEATFKKAIEIIDSEKTLFPFEYAIEIEKQTNVGDAFLDDLIDSYGEEKSAKIIGVPVEEVKRSKRHKIINAILLLNGKAKKKLEKRKAELLKIKELLIKREKPFKKPNTSSYLFDNSRRFYSDFEEGDVVAYKIKSGIYAGKYVILVVDYIKKEQVILCDETRLVRHNEVFALFDGIYDNVPELPKLFIYKTVKTTGDGQPVMLLLCNEDKKYKKFEFIKIGKTKPPKFELYKDYNEIAVRVSMCPYDVFCYENFDEKLIKIFGEKKDPDI